MTAKQTKPRGIKTTNRLAPLSILTGVVFVVLGVVFFLSQMTFTVKSYVLTEFARCLKGLCGEMCLLAPFLMAFIGIKALVSTRHRVSTRSVIALTGVFFCLLAGTHLITFVTGTGNLMDYIAKINSQKLMQYPDSYGAYLKRAYMLADSLGQSGGGLLGMALAYPLWELFGQALSIALLAIGVIALLLWLARVNPLALFKPQSTAERRERKGRQPDEAKPIEKPKRFGGQPAEQSIPLSPITQGQQVVKVESVYQPAPMPVQDYAPPTREDGFTPISNDGIYNEHIPLHDAAREEYQAPREQPTPQPVDIDDDPPFDYDEKLSAPIVRKSVSEKTPKQNEPDWAAQVRAAEKSLDTLKKPSNGKPKPVHTDPVMPLTGQKIPISHQAERTHRDSVESRAAYQTKLAISAKYTPPPMSLLEEAVKLPANVSAREDAFRTQIIEQTLASFGIESVVREIQHGPTITRFAIEIAQGIKVSRVAGTADNLALNLKNKHVRVEAPIQGTNYIGIEVPNLEGSIVSLREVLDSSPMRKNPSPLLVALGQDVAGAPVTCDLRNMPHLLIAGATGSGKSVCINTIICSIIYRATPAQVRMIMIDPKQVELSVYNALPHLIIPVISDPKKAGMALQWVVTEMIERYGKLKARKAHNIEEYNEIVRGTDQEMPNIVVIIDEMADLMDVCRKDIEESIRRLAALARAAGIYMVLATQRPSVDVITGVIKNNIPSRIAFSVSSGTDSRTIIDVYGAEKLLKKGDMLYKQSGANMVRVQGCLVKTKEINDIIDYVSSHYDTQFDPDFMEQLENEDNGRSDAATETGGKSEETVDEYLSVAIENAVDDGQISASMLQRRLSIGYARASRLVDEMEKRGIISRADGAKPRKTLITREEFNEKYLNL